MRKGKGKSKKDQKMGEVNGQGREKEGKGCSGPTRSDTFCENMPLAQKVGGRLSALPDRLRLQCMMGVELG